MGEAYFYHLTRGPVEGTLPTLISRALAQGWRVAVRGTDPARMDWLDQKLWLDGEEAFLPHGMSGGPHDADQPVLLTTSDAMPNGARCLIAVDRAPVTPDEVQSMERVCILFEGADETALGQARSLWKSLTGAGCKAKYWSEESGRWEMKRES